MKKLLPLPPLLLLFAAATLVHLSCAKEVNNDCPPDLPCATMTGENTFGCYINGKPWVANIADNWSILRPIDALYDEPGHGLYDNYYWRIYAQKVDDSTDNSIGLIFTPIHEKGVILINGLLSHDVWYRSLATPVYCKLDTLLPYYFEITRLDTAKNICAGKFDFFAVSPNKNDTLHFSQGRFDAIYQVE